MNDTTGKKAPEQPQLTTTIRELQATGSDPNTTAGEDAQGLPHSGSEKNIMTNGDNLAGLTRERIDGLSDVEAAETRARALIVQALSLESRSARLGNSDLIDKSIECWSQALSLTGEGHFARPERLDRLGVSLSSRFNRLGDPTDIGLATEYQTQAVHLTPEDHPNRPRRLANLGVSCGHRFDHLGTLADLDKAIEYMTEAVRLAPDSNADKPIWLSKLGMSWAHRFERLGELVDLDKAIEYQTQAVRLTSEDHADKPAMLDHLGMHWLHRFQRLGKLEDVDTAIEYTNKAVQLAPEGHVDTLKLFNNLGNALLRRFERFGKLADLDKAIESQTKAVQLAPEGHVHIPSLLINLGSSWLRRFERFGELSDLDKAVERQIQAVQLTPEGHSGKAGRLGNLGISILYRFDRLGELSDLDKAIEYQSVAAQLTPEGHGDKPTRLNALGGSWLRRFTRLGELADVDKAIECQTKAVELIPKPHTDEPIQLNNLGVSWMRRFAHLGELADLDKAIEYQTKAAQLSPEGDVGKPARLGNLGNSWRRRFERLGAVADAEKAIEYHTKAVQLIPDGHAQKLALLSNLGTTYESRYNQLHQLTDIESARSCFQHAAEEIVTNPEEQMKCARKWAHFSTLLGLSPLHAYRRAMTLIPRLVWLGTTIHSRYAFLAKITDLATEAAAWAVSVDSYDLALEWLEEGRSVVWAQILQLRTPLDNLSIADPGLASKLKDTARQLEGAGSRATAQESPAKLQSDLEAQARQHRSLAAKWEELLAEARELPGFHNFMRPRIARELKLAATDGPVVVINTHSNRCDALIIFPQRDDVVHVPLDNFSPQKALDFRSHLVSLVGNRARGDGEETRELKRVTAGDQIEPLMILWADVVNPVLNALGCTVRIPCPTTSQLLIVRWQREPSADQLPHVTWCATGPLAFLPLHAAGCYDNLSPNAFDLLISSYTPTLSALLSHKAPKLKPDVGVLAVGQANTEGLRPLPKTVAELAVINERAKGTNVQQLDGDRATVDAVLNAMDERSWVHLACHAIQNPTDATQSAFYLSDGKLTLETITKREFKNKGLAFLSACQTATGDDKLPDEAAHLAAGMLMAGYPSVVATMWSIRDADGPEIAGRVYEELLKDDQVDRKSVARALHKAVTELRQKVGSTSFMRWVPFIHLGL